MVLMMDGDTLLQRNLLALSSKNANATQAISQAEDNSTVDIRYSKTGHPVPVIPSGGRSRSLHSLVDPIREGQRIAEAYRKSGYFVVLGLGAGYHILPLLESVEISYILIIERDLSLCKKLFFQISYQDILLNPKINLLIDSTPEEIKHFILSNYYPAVSGNLQTVTLRARYEMDSSYFDDALSSIKDCIGELSDDYTVQAHFGKKWFSNTIANLKTAETSSCTLRPVTKALVTGAGPSLEDQIPYIKELQTKSYVLIATDTSLPSLIAFDILPDIVISIDCQHITYHHFLAGYPENIPLVLDLASPPTLTRITDKVFFFTSGHPFSLYVNSHWRQFPYIDISGGNVSHAAVSLAATLGAREIYLFGTDFSYPEGKSYARGTYLYPHFQSNASRFKPLEYFFIHFLLRNENIHRENTGNMIRYTTKPMISYKKRLEDSCTSLSSRIIPVQGKGVPLDFPHKETGQMRGSLSRLFSAGASSKGWYEFLHDYDEGLRNLKIPTKEPFSSYFANLEPHERDLWITLIPAAAAIRRENQKRDFDSRRILKRVKEWSRLIIRHYLRNYNR
jgi:hypothetical protein